MQSNNEIDFETVIRNSPKVVMNDCDSADYNGIIDLLQQELNDPNVVEHFFHNRNELLDSYKAKRFFTLHFSDGDNDWMHKNGADIRKLCRKRGFFLPGADSWMCFPAFCTTSAEGEIIMLWSAQTVQDWGLEEELVRQVNLYFSPTP